MTARAYYNEIEPAAAHVLRALIADGVIAPGDVDDRSITDVNPDDLKGYNQCHFFAGGGLWSVAARMAGWPDDKPIWTGSCPCQPLSVAGLGKGADDERHLWPAFYRIISECAPPIVFGEQVASALGREWFAGVRSDLEGLGYACGAADLCAASIGAPHIRQRLYWVGVALGDSMRCGRSGRSETPERIEKRGTSVERVGGGDMADADQQRRDGIDALLRGDAIERKAQADHETPRRSYWHDHEWLTGADGKARRSKPGVRLLVDGLPGRVGLLRIGGNAIVPQVAAEVISALMETAA